MKIELDDRELSHILAVLRYAQGAGSGMLGSVFRRMPHFHDHSPLTDCEVDMLCEKLNVEETRRCQRLM